ncbi:MAG: DUF4136 domain-containing protein [Cyclobacteriaceae bacterium]
MKNALKLLTLTVFFGCAVQVKTYQNPKANFAKYSSWCWMQGCEITYQGPEYYNDERAITEISNAIAWNMYDKGYLQSDETSDLVLNFYVIMEQDSMEVNSAYSSNFEDEWLSSLYPEYEQFLKGSLVIDVIDRRSSELVWTSNAIKYLSINPEFDKESIWAGVSKAMKKLPVRVE